MEQRKLRLRGLAAAAAVAALVACGPAPGSTPASSSAGSTTGATTSGASVSTPVSVSTAATRVTGAVNSGAAATELARQAPAAGTAAANAAATAPVRILGAQLNPTDPTLTIQNMSGQAVDLTGWRLKVGGSAVSMPSATRVGPNDTLTVHVASGASSGKDVYLGNEATMIAAALKPGAKVSLENQTGATVTEFALPA